MSPLNSKKPRQCSPWPSHDDVPLVPLPMSPPSGINTETNLLKGLRQPAVRHHLVSNRPTFEPVRSTNPSNHFPPQTKLLDTRSSSWLLDTVGLLAIHHTPALSLFFPRKVLRVKETVLSNIIYVSVAERVHVLPPQHLVATSVHQQYGDTGVFFSCKKDGLDLESAIETSISDVW
ncbi:hypothetical protein B0O80DRAFT_421814 [Mortierella sp. GBAus27b]|nr:hypothetical protein B0O80DRAFT_421814 [Mortierella sp. GBAus27b]